MRATPRRRPSRETFSTRTIRFESQGVDCVGTLYRPDRPTNPAVVLMGPGLAAERGFGLVRFGERVAEMGYAAVTFDYRGFGDSEGSPRGVVSPSRQRADWEAAIDRVRRLEGVDTTRLALWGISLSGGHVLQIAAEDPRIDAVVAITPLVDGRVLLRRRSRRDRLRALAVGLRDRLGAPIGRGRRVTVACPPDEIGVLTQPGAMESYLRLVPRESQWDNRVPARVFLELRNYRPLETLGETETPTLLIAGGDDAVVPLGTVAEAADRISGATFVRLPMGHFGPYEDNFEAVLGHQSAFLADALGP